MADIAKAYVQIIPSAEGIKGGIEKVIGGEAAHAGTNAGATIASNIKKMIVAAGIGKLLSDTLIGSLKAGGSLQQSFGGLETLYGEAADAAKEYAMEAAKAGISANTYAEQAVSFGAALKQAFGGDTHAAMEAANMAIMDMADNSAKMGTEIQSIQAAYQGFAKQNFTMLDNLKLGYGGTRTEMERLLKDAEAITGIHYDINNLGDIYSAIHVIQEELGIAGVAAEEATNTLTGSANAVKAAWQNTLAAMSLGMDLGPALQTLGDAVSAFFGQNFFPMIAEFFKNSPALVDGLMQMITNGLNSVAQNGEAIGAGIFSIMSALGAAIVQNAPQLLLAFALAFTEVAHNLLVSVGGALDAASSQLVSRLAQKIQELGIPQMLEKGKALVQQIISGIQQKIGDVVTAMTGLIDRAKTAFTGFDWAGLGRDIISGIVSGITGAAGAIGDALLGAASSAWNSAKNFFKVGSPSKLMADTVGRWIPAGIAEGITDNLQTLYSAVDTMGSAITSSIMGNAAYQPQPAYNGLEDLASALNSQQANANVTVVLQGDANKLFKVVRKENNKFKTSTGQSAFTY